MRLAQYAWVLVLALGLAGCGGDSGSQQVLYKSAPPEDLTTAGSPDALEVSWTAAPHAVRYNVYYSSDPQQWIENYAAYADAGLEITEQTFVELDLSALTKHVYFQVTGEIDREGDPSFAVALLGYRINTVDPGLVDDHINALAWDRCPRGMTLVSGACDGTPDQPTGTEVELEYGAAPSGTEPRPPTYSEWLSLMDCGRNAEPRFDDAHDDACEALRPQLLLDHSGRAFYVYDDVGMCDEGQMRVVSPPDQSICLSLDSSVHVTLVRIPD